MSKFIEPISSYTRQEIAKQASMINSIEYFYKWPLVFAERGDKILLNSGVKTGILDIKNIKKPTDFKDFVYEVAAQNEHIRNHGSLNTYV